MDNERLTLQELQQTEEYKREVKELLHKMKQEEGYVGVSDLAERFEGVDNEYNHSPWNLLQILTNIKIFIPLRLDDEVSNFDKLKKKVSSNKCLKHVNTRKQMNKITTTLKEFRKAKGLTQENINRMTGLSQQMVSKIETGKGNPSLESFIDYCNGLGIDLLQVLIDQF